MAWDTLGALDLSIPVDRHLQWHSGTQHQLVSVIGRSRRVGIAYGTQGETGTVYHQVTPANAGGSTYLDVNARMRAIEAMFDDDPYSTLAGDNGASLRVIVQEIDFDEVEPGHTPLGIVAIKYAEVTP